MNMNKKLFAIFLVLLSFFLLSNVTYAATSQVVSCNSFTSEKTCSTSGKCRWISGSCQEQYVAQAPCDNNNIRTVLKIAGYILLLAKLIIPMLIIFYGILDMYKAVVDKDEKSITKQAKQLIIRIVTGLIVFFIPSFVSAIFSLSDALDIIETDEYKTCASCVLDPLDDACSTTDIFPDAGVNN